MSKTDDLLTRLKARIEALPRIVPADLNPEELFNRNGEYVYLDELLPLLADLAEAVRLDQQETETLRDTIVELDHDCVYVNLKQRVQALEAELQGHREWRQADTDSASFLKAQAAKHIAELEAELTALRTELEAIKIDREAIHNSGYPTKRGSNAM